MLRPVRFVVALAGLLALGPALVTPQERVTLGGPPQVAFPPPPISATQSPGAMEVSLDGYLTALAAEDRFAGVVLLANEGKTIFHKAYGLADRANQLPITLDTRFNLSSVNKMFTMAAVAGLKAKGRLKGSDTVGALLPDYPNAQAHQATVDQLLNHRGGISDFFGSDFDAASPARFRSNADYFAFVAPRPLYFEPGTQRRYCNGCYIVLGEIIARVTGMPYERYMQEAIFAPRGMTRTGWIQADDIVDGIAMGYTRRGRPDDGKLRANLYTRGAAGSAAGGAFSTTGDLLAFVTHEAKAAGREANAISGGSPGSNALVESNGPWMVIVLSNVDPPAASVGVAILRQLSGRPDGP